MFLLLTLAAVADPVPPPPAALPSEQGPQVRWITDSARPAAAHVEVTGLRAGVWEELKPRVEQVLSVYVEPAGPHGDSTVPAMVGTYTVTGEVLRFEPAFALTAGMTYRALLRLAEVPGNPSGRVLSAIYSLPARHLSPTTVVSQTYPSADVLPENLLKFYVHFSAPMSRGRVYEHIRLLTETGQAVEQPFLEVDEELWDPRMQRLTLFLDPGRIKRGVRPLEEIGPALEQGRRYSLFIDQGLQDGQGTPLRDSFRREFRVEPPDRQSPNPGQWKIVTPLSGTRDPLVIDFAEPLDHALAQRLIGILQQDGKPLGGIIDLVHREELWTFVPDRLWTAGSYQLVVGGTLEDLAGNSVGRPFEVDLFETVERKVPQERVTLEFRVR